MPDRATYLARLLVNRVAGCDGLEAGGDAGDGEVAARRNDAIAKVLVVETGITDGVVVRQVAEALPAKRQGGAVWDRDVAEFAGFLRERLGL